MALDRFVYWKKVPKKQRPMFMDIKQVLEDYLEGAACGSVDVDERRLTVRLHGRPRCPFRRCYGYGDIAQAMEQHRERWFEVYVADDHIDVITRQTDEYTNVVAEGFAALCARFWKGKRSE